MAEEASWFSAPGLVAVCIVGFVAYSCTSASVEKSAAPPDPGAAARSACQQFIKRLAHDPDSVEFDQPWDWTTIKNSDGSWSVGAKFRARNGFGGMRSEYRTCVMNQTGDNWSLVSASKMG